MHHYIRIHAAELAPIHPFPDKLPDQTATWFEDLADSAIREVGEVPHFCDNELEDSSAGIIDEK